MSSHEESVAQFEYLGSAASAVSAGSVDAAAFPPPSDSAASVVSAGSVAADWATTTLPLRGEDVHVDEDAGGRFAACPIFDPAPITPVRTSADGALGGPPVDAEDRRASAWTRVVRRTTV